MRALFTPAFINSRLAYSLGQVTLNVFFYASNRSRRVNLGYGYDLYLVVKRFGLLGSGFPF